MTMNSIRLREQRSTILRSIERRKKSRRQKEPIGERATWVMIIADWRGDEPKDVKEGYEKLSKE